MKTRNIIGWSITVILIAAFLTAMATLFGLVNSLIMIAIVGAFIGLIILAVNLIVD